MAREHGFGEETTGLILSSFFAGYACTQVAGGWAAAAYGGKPVLLFAVLVWSLATALTPVAAGASVPVLVGVRVIMGVGEGVSLPAMHHLTALWCPLEERSRFVAFCNSGQCAFSPFLSCAAVRRLHSRLLTAVARRVQTPGGPGGAGRARRPAPPAGGKRRHPCVATPRRARRVTPCLRTFRNRAQCA